MTFEEYRIKADVVAQYPGRFSSKGINYCLMGIGGESGEILEKVKKIYRDKNSIIDSQAKEWLMQEIGDVLWYCSQIYSEHGLPFEKLLAVPDHINEIKYFQTFVATGHYIKVGNIEGLRQRCFNLLSAAGKLLMGANTFSLFGYRQWITIIVYNLATICIEADIDLEEAAVTNIEKLYSRKERGQLQGSGDNR